MATANHALPATPASSIAVDGKDGERHAATADGLSRLGADTYTVNETQYNELAPAVDLIAEHIRTLAALAPARYREFAQYATIAEEDDRTDATEMIRRLVTGQDLVVRTAKPLFPAVEQAHDEPSIDPCRVRWSARRRLLAKRIQAHETSAWILRSLLA